MPKKPRKIEQLCDAISRYKPEDIDTVLSDNAYILFLTRNLRSATGVDRANILLLIVLYLRRGLVLAADHLTEVLGRVPEGYAPDVDKCEPMSGQRALKAALDFLATVAVEMPQYTGRDLPKLNLLALFDDCVKAGLSDREKIEKYLSRLKTTHDNLGISFQNAISAFEPRAQRRIAFLCSLEISDRQKLSFEQQTRLSEFKLAPKDALLQQFYLIILNAQRDLDLEAVCESAGYCMGDLQKNFSAVTGVYLGRGTEPHALQTCRLQMHLYFNAYMKQDPREGWLAYLNPRIFLPMLRSQFAAVIQDYPSLSMPLDQLFQVFKQMAEGDPVAQLNVQYLELYLEPYQKGEWDKLKGDDYKASVSRYITNLYEIYQAHKEALDESYLVALSAGLDFLIQVDTMLRAGYRFKVEGSTWTCIDHGTMIGIADITTEECPGLTEMIEEYRSHVMSDYKSVSEEEEIFRVKAARMLQQMQIDTSPEPIPGISLGRN
ncbi:MAG: hypothetical protein A3C55_06955 [Gammaproteobacteria bacterium RIFCSPHIGHO2_02_FULL_42_13]|nr:MAG: hypothetical protein A3C55_06955 [Gammaproteobacteria bacterium RIFCSPHIGHO2_02_FULL_42_13]